MPTDCELRFTLPDTLKVPQISQHGKAVDIIGKFGGTDQLPNAERLHRAMAFRDSCTSALPPFI
jgi:hypothetical protein